MKFKGSEYLGYIETWPVFKNRPEHKNLHILEIKTRYNHHRLLIERELNEYFLQLNWINNQIQSKGAKPSPTDLGLKQLLSRSEFFENKSNTEAILQGFVSCSF